MPQVIKKQQQVQILPLPTLGISYSLHLPRASNLSACSLSGRPESLNLYQKAVLPGTIELQRLTKLWLAKLPCLYSQTYTSIYRTLKNGANRYWF
jgi:hypothetical protein